MHSLKGSPHVIDIRNIGLLAAIELAPRKDPAAGSRAADASKLCFESGVLVRTGGNSLVLSPPLIISESEIGRVFETISMALKAID